MKHGHHQIHTVGYLMINYIVDNKVKVKHVMASPQYFGEALLKTLNQFLLLSFQQSLVADLNGILLRGSYTSTSLERAFRFIMRSYL